MLEGSHIQERDWMKAAKVLFVAILLSVITSSRAQAPTPSLTGDHELLAQLEPILSAHQCVQPFQRERKV